MVAIVLSLRDTVRQTTDGACATRAAIDEKYWKVFAVPHIIVLRLFHAAIALAGSNNNMSPVCNRTCGVHAMVKR